MKFLRTSSIIILLTVAVNALVGGYFFIRNPSGQDLDISTDALSYSPFRDFLIPGIILFVINGLLNLIAATAVFLKWKNYPKFVTAQGILLIGWVLVQVLMLRQLFFLHFVLAGLGILMIILGVLLAPLVQKPEEESSKEKLT